MYYVLCPYGLITGGPDALHQMVFYLNKINKEAKLVYFNTKHYDLAIPKQYQCYVKNYILEKDIVDSCENTIIVPEFVSNKSFRFVKSKVYIWWLSVFYNKNQTSILYKTFFALTYPIRYLKYKNNHNIDVVRFLNNSLFKKRYKFSNEKKNLSHLCASNYAYEYVKKRSKNQCKLCIEPISKIFLERQGGDIKKDIVLYNPKKSGKFVEKIMKKDKNINFVPLINLSQEELIKKYQTAKLYIDFGPFPGAERMPKEAVINGCLILTGTNGASGFYGDVPIDSKYKIKSNRKNIKKILLTISYMLKNYEIIIDDFLTYKNMVNNLENEFIESIKKI